MVILFLYQEADFGIRGGSRMQTFFASPILRQYDILRLSVGALRPRERFPVIRKYVDESDVLAIVQGQYTFARSWPRQAGMYGFSKNRPMLSIDAASIDEGWSKEAMVGPTPFLYLKWRKHKGSVVVFNSSYFFDHLFWRRKLAVPQDSISYRLQGQQGLFDEFCPVFRWSSESYFERLLPIEIDRALYLSGHSV